MLPPEQAAQPNPSYPAPCRQDTTPPWSTDFGGTNASNKTYLKERQDKRKEEAFFLRKMKRKRNKSKKKIKKRVFFFKTRKNEKRARRGTPRDGSKK